MAIYVTIPMTEPDLAWLRQACGEEVLTGSPDRGNEADFKRCDILLGRVPEKWITHSEQLRWIQLGSVGFDDLLSWNWASLGKRLQVTNLSGFFANPVAETAMAGLLAVLRGIDQLVRLQSEARWDKMTVRPTLRSLQNAQVLLAGYGEIARRFEQLIQPFNCKTVSFSRSQPLQNEQVALSEADVIFCSMPETDQTRGWFNDRRLAMLKSSAIFVNVGRGGVVDERALIRRLQTRQLAAAVLDVTTIEPLPADHPLWRLPNVLLTQHTAGGSNDETRGIAKFFLANFKRFRNGQPLEAVVDFQRGY